MKRIALLFNLFLQTAPAADPPPSVKFDPDVANWKPVPHPKDLKSEAFSQFLSKANYAWVEWGVSRRDGKIVAIAQHELPDERPPFLTPKQGDPPDKEYPRYVQRVSNGWLAGYNRGEFGASLAWYSSDGKARQDISKDQVNAFILCKGRTFAVTGLAHKGLSYGGLIEISKVGEQWKVSTLLKLPASGEAVDLLPDGRFLIVTSEGLLAVSLDKKVETLVAEGEWDGLYPGSIAVDAKAQRAYIGMRQFVVAYDLAKNDHTWEYLLPDPMFLNKSSEP